MGQRYAEIADLTVPAAALSSISTPDQNDFLLKASVFADSYLASRFELPLVTWGSDLKDAVAAIATFRLLMKRGFSPEAGDNKTYQDQYKDAVSWLKDVGSGKATPVDVVDSSAGGVNSTTPGFEGANAPV